jgi:hypothetical protein
MPGTFSRSLRVAAGFRIRYSTILCPLSFCKNVRTFCSVSENFPEFSKYRTSGPVLNAVIFPKIFRSARWYRGVLRVIPVFRAFYFNLSG